MLALALLVIGAGVGVRVEEARGVSTEDAQALAAIFARAIGERSGRAATVDPSAVACERPDRCVKEILARTSASDIVFVRFVGVPTRIRVLAELGPQNAELDIDRPRANWPRGMEQLAAKLFARPVALETRVSRDPPSEPQRATSANGARNANNAMGVTNAKGASNAGDAKGANSAGNAKGASNAEGANNTKGANNAMGASNAKSADNANSAKGASNAARTSSANDAKSARDANAESTARGGDDARRTSGVRGAENSGVATGANPAMATEPAAGITDTTTPGDAREPRWEPWAVLGGSAIAGVVGIGFGVSSSDARDHAASEPHTNQELADLDDRAFGHGLAANILFGVAVAGVATGVVWLLAGD